MTNQKLAATEIVTAINGAEPDEKVVEMSEETKKRYTEESEPMKLTNLFVDHPCKVMGVGYCGLIILCVIAFSANFFDMNTEQGREWYVWDDPITKDFEKFTLADTYVDKNTGKAQLDVRAKRSGIMFFIYEKQGNAAEGMINREHF